MIATMQQIARTPYAMIGIFFAVLALISVTLQLQARLIPDGNAFTWQVVSGVALLSTMTCQWWFLRLRWLGKVTRRNLVIHRWSGVIATLIFISHATRMGHIWMTGITTLFILIALTGVLNKEVLRFQSRTAYLIWLGVHISLSVAILPLILVHVWVALAY